MYKKGQSIRLQLVKKEKNGKKERDMKKESIVGRTLSHVCRVRQDFLLFELLDVCNLSAQSGPTDSRSILSTLNCKIGRRSRLEEVRQWQGSCGRFQFGSHARVSAGVQRDEILLQGYSK